MIFHYEEITTQIRRPIIPILLKSKKAFIIYRALIDSGSDHCIFSKDLADLLEIPLSPKNKIVFRGISSENIEGFSSEIGIRVGNVNYQTRVIFAEISDFGHGILGQKGFFDHFDVNLSYQKQTVKLDQIDPRAND